MVVEILIAVGVLLVLVGIVGLIGGVARLFKRDSKRADAGADEK